MKSHEVFQAMNDIDDVMQGILTDIESKRERAGIKMNVMVVSDYGLTDSEHLTPIPLDQLLDMDQIQYIILSSGYASVIPYALSYQKILVDTDTINSAGEDTKVSIFLGAQMKGQPIPSRTHRYSRISSTTLKESGPRTSFSSHTQVQNCRPYH